MKLYQSMTQTWPSGPTSAMIGAVHSSSLATRLKGLRERKSLPWRGSPKVPTRCPAGPGAEAGGVQVPLGGGGGGVRGAPRRAGVAAVPIDLPHLLGDRLEEVVVGDRPQHQRRRPAPHGLVVAVRDRHVH